MTRKRIRISSNIEDLENIRQPELRCVITIFREISDLDAHDRLMTQLQIEFYDKLNIEEFSEDFFECMRIVLIFNDRVKSETPLLFCVRFVIKCLKQKNKNCDLLLKRFIKFMTSQSNDDDPIVRFHCVQTCRILLTELTDDLPVPEILFEKIQQSLLSRFWDVKPYVRSEAVRASSRLQDPVDANCPIVTGLMHICKYDSSDKARLAALQALAITTKTLPCVIERTRDISDIVRKKSYDLITKWKILKPLSISSRLTIIECGLTDKSDTVKAACKELLKVWLVASENDMVALLRRFDVENMERSTELALNGLLECLTLNDVISLVDRFRALMDDDLLITEEHLNAESAFLWRHLVVFISNKSDEFEGQLDRILPSVPKFEQYLRRLFQKPIDQNLRCEISLDEYAEYCTIIRNLLPIVNYIDIFDPYNRGLIIDLIKWAMSSVDIPFNYVDHLMKLLVHLESNNTKICDQTVTLINELLFGDNDAIATADMSGQDNQENTDPISADRTHTEDTTINNPEVLRKMKIEIAEIDVKINVLKEEVNIGIQDNNLESLHSIISELKSLEIKKKELTELKDKMVTLSEEKGIIGEVERDEIINVDEVVKRESEDNARLWMASGNESRIIKANIMTISMIKECNMLWTMPSSLRSLLDNVILVSIRHTDTCVREKAILALGLCCLLDKDLAITYYAIFLKSLEVDLDQVKEVAANSLVDLFIRFGLEPFQDAMMATHRKVKQESVTSVDNDEEPNEEEQNKCVAELITPVVMLLTSEKTELQTLAAIGISKLMYHHKIISSRLLSRLLLMWFDPQFTDNAQLRTHLGAFFTNYSLMSSANQESMAGCFIITMETLFKAPASNSQSEIDIGNVVDFFVRVTDSKYLMDNLRSKTEREPVQTNTSHTQDNPCHDMLGRMISNQILLAPLSAGVKYYVAMLIKLRFSPNNVDIISEIDPMVVTMINKLKDKKSVQSLVKYHSDLQSQLQQEPIADDNAVDADSNNAPNTPTLLELSANGNVRESVYIGTRVPSNLIVDDTAQTISNSTVTPIESLSTISEHEPSKRAKSSVKSTPKKVNDDANFKKPMTIKSTRASARKMLSTPIAADRSDNATRRLTRSASAKKN